LADWKDESVLEAWQQRVDDFAGLRKPGKLSLWQELMRSQLSGRRIEPTSEVPPPQGIGSASPIALCEMRLSMPMAIDVTINVPNLQDVDISAGGIFVTWGSTKGAAQTAEIDIGRGWRHPFFASFLRVDYAAVRDGIFLPGNQPADLVVTATISPTTGAQGMPLTCTRFFDQAIANGSVSLRNIPAFAKYVTLGGSPGGNFPMIEVEALFSMQNASSVTLWRQQFHADAMTQNPSWLFNQKKWPVPQRASIYRLQNFNLNSLGQTTAIADLQL